MGVAQSDIEAAGEAAQRRVDEAVAAARAGTAPNPAAALADVYTGKLRTGAGAHP
jgi:TPP-dependent pyruvate/acetoin dehydrogenase alpha subunit